LRKSIFEDSADGKSYLSSLNTFISWGLIDEQEYRAYGMRYSRLTINEKVRTKKVSKLYWMRRLSVNKYSENVLDQELLRRDSEFTKECVTKIGGCVGYETL
jgi:hypothetical protein